MADKRIVYLSYDGLTDPLGQSQILPYVIGLAKLGYRFTIISFEKPDRFNAQNKTIKQQTDEASIQWIPLTYHKNPPVLSTLFDLWRLWRTFLKIHRTTKFDIVHCRSYLTSLIGLRAKRKMGVKFIFDMRGFWADERVEGGLWNLKNPVFKLIYMFFKKREKLFLEKADAVISLTHAAKNYLCQTYAISESKIIIIPCCVDLEVFNPASIDIDARENLRTSLKLSQNSFVLLYLGSLGTWYLKDEMLACFSLLKTKEPSAKFLILTPDIDSINPTDDIIVLSVTRSEVPVYCTLANAALCFIQPSFSKMASSATKVGEVLAMGIPIISNTGWGDMEIFSKSTSAISICDLKTLADFNYSKLNSNSDDARAFAEANFSLQTGIVSYLETYNRV